MSYAKRIKASIIELFTRETEYQEEKKYYHNGDNNLYPYEIEKVVSNSSTASRATAVGVKFISGKGVVLKNTEEKVGQEEKDRLESLVHQTALNIFVQNGCFFKVHYTIDEQGEIVIDKSRVKILDYVKCRIGKSDDDGNAGKIFYRDFYDKRTKKFKKQNIDDEKSFYPFNPDPKVVLSQIRREWKERQDRGSGVGSSNEEDLGTVAQMVKNFSGQVLYVNTTPQYVYALSRFDPVYDDCDSEYRISLYTNTNVREGFLGKTAVVTSGLDPDTASTVKEDLKKWLGAENSSNLYHLDIEGIENIEDALKVIQVSANYDEGLFVETDKRLRRNILGAANNLPEPLIYASEGALFGTSGETYKQMKLFYSEQTQYERDLIEKIFHRFGIDFDIVPLINEEELKKEGDEHS